MEEEIKKACQILEEGGIILYPTDTIWGIGCDATNENAVKKIFDIKKRADSKSMLVLVDSAAKLPYYINEVPDIAYDLIELSDKPLTIIYPGARNVATNLIAEDGTLGIRITKEKFSHHLCQRFRKPIVSTSANISGDASPSCFREIKKAILRSVDHIVNVRRDENQPIKPSGIIKLGIKGEIEIIRK